MKKSLYLLVGILVLFRSLPVFAYSYQDIASRDIINIVKALAIFISLLLAILIISCLANIKYFKIAIRNKKLFLITIVPLFISCLIFLAFYVLGLMEEIKKVDEYEMLYPSCTTSNVDWGSHLRPCYVLNLYGPILSSINLTLLFLFSYYLLIMAYGIYYLKKIDKNIGFGILKLCITVIVMAIIAYMVVIVISTPTPGI